MSDQPGLDGKYTIFARVVEGILVEQTISEAAVDGTGLAADRIVVHKVAIRDKPPAVPEPFVAESVEELARYRNFLRLAQAGVYGGMSFHRVVKGFVIQSGHLPTRSAPLGEAQQKYVRQMKAEFSDRPHDKGTLSMARLADADSASTSFFIVTARAEALDGKYSAFGRVEQGLDVVEKIEAVAVQGEAPIDRVELRKVTVVK